MQFQHLQLYYNLFQGDLHAYLNRKGALKPINAVKFALDIARSVNCFLRNKCILLAFIVLQKSSFVLGIDFKD